MKKILGIIVLGLLLSGCGGGYSIFNAYIDQENPNGGVIRNHLASSTGQGGIKSLADSSCTSRGFVEAKLTSTGKAGEFKTHNFKCISKVEKNETQKAELIFTIKDKKEQCTAIGFKPATEKFADCVLRLVELDVKSQQATQIALAQSQGNQMVADQLKKQNNSRSSDAFINLGTQLLNPQSTVSAPSTSTCRVIGSGAYKTVNCW